MVSAARLLRSVGSLEPTEANYQTNISCAAVIAIGALALVFPALPWSSATPPQAPVQQVAAVQPAPSLGANVEAESEAKEEPVQRAPSPACAARSWPYVCTEAPAGEVAERRVRVISADRNAPMSVVVSASTRSAPVAALTPAAVAETPIQPLNAVSGDVPFAAASAEVTPIAAITDPSVADATASARTSKAKSQQAKPVRAARKQSKAQRVARMAARRHGALAYNDSGEASDRALGYAAYPRHGMESYPWAGLR